MTDFDPVSRASGIALNLPPCSGVIPEHCPRRLSVLVEPAALVLDEPGTGQLRPDLRVCLGRIGGLLHHARPVTRRRLADLVDDAAAHGTPAANDREDDRRLHSTRDDYVLGAGRAIEEIQFG